MKMKRKRSWINQTKIVKSFCNQFRSPAQQMFSPVTCAQLFLWIIFKETGTLVCSSSILLAISKSNTYAYFGASLNGVIRKSIFHLGYIPSSAALLLLCHFRRKLISYKPPTSQIPNLHCSVLRKRNHIFKSNDFPLKLQSIGVSLKLVAAFRIWFLQKLKQLSFVAFFMFSHFSYNHGIY